MLDLRLARQGSPRGFTLIEVVVASTVLAGLVVMALQVTTMTTNSISEKLLLANLEIKGEETIKLLTDELTEATKVEFEATGDKLTFRRPLNLTFSKQTDTELGDWMTSTLVYGNLNQLQYVKQSETTVREADVYMDLNGDGDYTDTMTFDLGRINLTTDLGSANENTIAKGVDNIVQAQPHGAAISQLSSGKIFDLPNGSTLLIINIYCVAINQVTQKTHMTLITGQVFLRNQGHFL